MSSNTTLMNSTEDKTKDNNGDLQKMRQKAPESYSENPLNKDKDKYTAQNKVPSLNKSGSDSKNETEKTEKLDTKKYLYH